jgi:eukaryotic-like serine/threonine-protein kinase
VIADPPGGTRAEEAGEGRALGSGETIGKYRLDRVLGEGGMGIVWAAFDPDLERAIAIKLLRGGGAEATLRSRLLREARAMARLKHPNVLTVYEVGTDQNRDYIAMELVDGESLEAWLATRPPREQVMAALMAAGAGLAAAHEAGLVHRDFKPHNVLRSRSGHIYVTDFGLARGNIEEGVEVDQLPATDSGSPIERSPRGVTALPDRLASGLRRPLDSLLDSPLTQTGVLIGTPAYMAPEQFAGRMPDARSDQFAFCVTAWEALTGRRPFGGTTLAELESAATRGAGDLAADEVPSSVRAVLVRGLDPSPSARWPDLPALLAALAEAVHASAPVRSARRRWLTIGAIAAASAAVSIALTMVASDRSRSADDDDGCTSAEEAFGDAWSESRRAAVVRVHRGGGAIGAIVVLDDVRRKWLETYAAACAAPLTDQSRGQLACLRRVRDEVAAVSDQIARPGSDLSMTEVGLLTVSVGRCDPDRDDGDGFIPPGFIPPTPVPPLPPRAP